MFSSFGVGADDHKKKNTSHDTHEEHHENHHDHEVDVVLHDDHDHDTDTGQIAVDVLDCPSAIIIVAPVAGVDPSEVDIALSRNILTISGNRKEAPIYLEAKRMLVEECFYGAFSRSIILPENLGFDKIKATIEHNVLTIEIPKLTLLSQSIKIQK